MVMLRLFKDVAVVVLLIGLSACGSHPWEATERVPVRGAEFAESPKSEAAQLVAEGILLFLNHESTTVLLLDKGVGIDQRAALGIIAYRNGKDSIFGTEDDRPFESINEIDAIEWVGPSAIGLIKNYVIEHGWIPKDDPLVGVYDGVAFTKNESDGVLALVNGADFETLDELIDTRAAYVIIEDRPYDSIQILSGVKWLGTVGLMSLKGAVNKT